MANKTMMNTMFLVLSFILFVSIADANLFAAKVENNVKEASLECNSLFGVREGDSCFAVSQMFNLTTQAFTMLNPNLNCAKLFVGEWLCVNGAP
ncbi:hypothetical protein UlMin_011739 [Ulmus minor]